MAILQIVSNLPFLLSLSPHYLVPGTVIYCPNGNSQIPDGNHRLANLAGSQYVEWNVQMAGALIITIPPLLVYIFLGRYFIRGLLAGSVKG